MGKRSNSSSLKCERDEMLFKYYLQVIKSYGPAARFVPLKQKFNDTATPFFISPQVAGRIIGQMLKKRGIHHSNLSTFECDELLEKLNHITLNNDTFQLCKGVDKILAEIGVNVPDDKIIHLVNKHIINGQ